jgi:thioredoxin 1
MAVIDVDESTWEKEVLKSETPVIVDFWAPWCPWCRRLEPEFRALSEEYGGRLKFFKLNVDDSPKVGPRYGVMGLPTLKFFCAGRPLGEIVGYLPRKALKMQLDNMLAAYKDCLDQSTPTTGHAPGHT